MIQTNEMKQTSLSRARIFSKKLDQQLSTIEKVPGFVL